MYGGEVERLGEHARVAACLHQARHPVDEQRGLLRCRLEHVGRARRLPGTNGVGEALPQSDASKRIIVHDVGDDSLRNARDVSVSLKVVPALVHQPHRHECVQQQLGSPGVRTAQRSDFPGLRNPSASNTLRVTGRVQDAGLGVARSGARAREIPCAAVSIKSFPQVPDEPRDDVGRLCAPRRRVVDAGGCRSPRRERASKMGVASVRHRHVRAPGGPLSRCSSCSRAFSVSCALRASRFMAIRPFTATIVHHRLHRRVDASHLQRRPVPQQAAAALLAERRRVSVPLCGSPGSRVAVTVVAPSRRKTAAFSQKCSGGLLWYGSPLQVRCVHSPVRAMVRAIVAYMAGSPSSGWLATRTRQKTLASTTSTVTWTAGRANVSVARERSPSCSRARDDCCTPPASTTRRRGAHEPTDVIAALRLVWRLREGLDRDSRAWNFASSRA